MLTYISNVTFITSHAAVKLILPLLLLVFSVFAQTKPADDIRSLTVGQSIERELSGGQAHTYAVNLTAGQLLRVEILPKGIDIIVSLHAPDGKLLADMEGKSGSVWRAAVSAVAAASGEHKVELRGIRAAYPGAAYEFKVIEIRNPTSQDHMRIEAEGRLTKGLKRDRSQGEAAIQDFEASLRIWHDLGEKNWEGKTAFNLGFAYAQQQRFDQAIKAYSQALELFKETKEHLDEARVGLNLGTTFMSLNQLEKAKESFTLVSGIAREFKDFLLLRNSLTNLGTADNYLGQYETSRGYYEQALAITKQLGDRQMEGVLITALGNTYREQGQSEKSREFYEQGLAIAREVKDQRYEGVNLNNLGNAHVQMSQFEKAQDYYTQSLAFRRKIKDRRGEGISLFNLGGLGLIFSKWETSEEYYMQALAIMREIKDRQLEFQVLMGLATLNAKRKKFERAQSLYIEALAISRELKSKPNEGTILSNLGNVFRDNGQYELAMNHFSQALAISKELKLKDLEASTLQNLGAVHSDLRQNEKAQAHFEQSLAIRVETRDQLGEGMALSRIMVLQIQYNDPKSAILYGKQAINTFQKIRDRIAVLDQQARQGFLESVEETYRALADALILQGRLAETHEVLRSFKDQQFFDIHSSLKPKPLTLTSRETDLGSRYENISRNITATRESLDDLLQKIGKHPPNPEESSEIQKREREAKTATDDFLTFFKQVETEFSKSIGEKDKVGEITDQVEMQTALRELSTPTGQNTVVVHQLVGEDNFRALIVTPDGINSVSTPIKGAILNEQAKRLWAVLQTDKHDATKLGKQLYDIVFKPIEKELPKNTKTILWALDGNLRYVPMAALHDGKQYLVERFNHVTFTRADKERMVRSVQPNWTATAFGSAKEQTVELLGSKIPFSALPGVSDEMGSLFGQKDKKSGIFEGEALLDAKFTRDAMLAALKQKRPVVHIASHFSFRPGDEARSFLLMGDGTAFTLDEMKKHTDLFAGVDLLTLSACNTGAQQADANGREVDAFFELAQRLGANSVMATLWSVADNSTPWLMREFYKGKIEKKFTKAESLRRAQLALLKGNSDAVANTRDRNDSANAKANLIVVTKDGKRDANTRADEFVVSEAQAPPFKKDPKRPFAHPFYWSPFVLIGNWK